MSQLTATVFQPGHTLLHRLPVGLKLVGLAAFSLAVVVVRSPLSAAAFLLAALTAAALARLRLVTLTRAARGVVVVAAVVGLLQWWWYGGARAIESFLDLFSLGISAVVVTATTPVNAMLDALVRWLGPFRRLRVNPERVALTFALAVGALPGTVTLARETRDAARARGLGRAPRAWLAPFVIRVVARAMETGDALQARGLGDDPTRE